MTSLTTLLAAAANGSDESFWMPKAASTVAGQTDALFYFILYLGAFFLALITVVTVLFVIKYRRAKAGDQTSPIEGNQRLEVAWSVVPAVLLVGMFVWSFRGYMSLTIAPPGAMEVRVLAQKWNWSFDYPKYGIVGAGELVVPQGQPVKLIMSAKEVIHSFFVPAFRIKKDVLPNRYSVLWFEATELGTYDIRCAEYCGTGHSQMISHVKVVPTTAFEEWASSGGGPPDGEKLFANKGCVACHSRTTDRMGLPGPPLAGKHGKTELLANGSSVTVDDNYLRESIVNPTAKVVQGYTPVMPTFAGQLNDAQLNALIDYIKSLK